jgi:flagellar L-ring protein precursor FlgH
MTGLRPLARAIGAIVAAAAISAALPDPAAARKAPKPSGYEPTLPVVEPAPVANGSIFQASMGYGPLYEGNRARRLGDPLMVRLIETTSAAKSVNSKSDKGGGASITPPSEGWLSFLNPNALKASSSSTFNGQGNAGQTSSLNSTLSVTIAEVRPNGTALIRGEKQMMLSQGEEWVRFSGIVRLVDIDADNIVLSTRVAGARIEYSGKGALQQASKQGWLGRFFNKISPF